MGIEPTYPAWKAGVLPLNYTRTFKVPRTGIEPVTRGFSVLCSTNWAIWAFVIFTFVKTWVAGTGFEPMTFGLWARRASRLLHPAIWSYCLSANGWRWIRTTEAICSRFTVCPLWPLGNPSIWYCYHKPMIGLEPITCWLQISCSANWATSAYVITEMTPTGIEPVLPPWKGDVLTAWPWSHIYLLHKNILHKITPRVGLEPTTTRLTAECSTIELSRIIQKVYTFKTDTEPFSIFFPS